MTFNPFNFFRRNQRAIFAVITVFIMFTFVLSSGLGGGVDFFDWFPSWLGAKSRKGDQLASIDGTKIYDGDLANLRRQRVMANRFMDLAAGQSELYLRRSVSDQLARVSPEFRPALMAGLNWEQQAAQFAAQFGNNPRIMQLLMDQTQSGLAAILNAPTAKPEDREAASKLLYAMALGQLRARTRGELYFVNAPNTTQRDLLNFMLWEKKADQLGIKFTPDDVKQLVQKEFMGEFRDDVPVREAMQRNMPWFTVDGLLKALAAEFRVRAAQTAVLGNSGRTNRTLTFPPLFTAPYEVFDFYREQCSPTSYQVLAVPAANFMGAVAGTPTEDELRRLYDKYKDDEPNPGREDPGFKDPRKVKLEWLSAKGDEPYFTKAAAEWLPKGQLAALLFPPGPLGPFGWEAVATLPLAVTDPLVQKEYDEAIVRRHTSDLAIQWSGSRFLTQYLDTSVVKPRNLAAAVGGGALAALGNPFAAGSLTQAAAEAAEAKDRIAAGVPLVLGAVPGFGMGGTMLAGAATYQAAIPAPLPLDAVKGELARQLAERKARQLMLKEFETFQTEVAKLTKDAKTKDAAKAYIAEFAKARGLTTGASKDFADEWTIEDDAGLETLKAALKQSPHGNLPVKFGKRFFWLDDQRFGPAGPKVAATGTYRPEYYPAAPRPEVSPFAKPDPTYLVWRTEEKPAAPQAFLAARPKVLEAWQRMKARELAKAEAEKIAGAMRTNASTSALQIDQDLRDAQARLQAGVTDPKAKDKVKLFTVDGVCPLSPVTDLGGGSPMQTVQPFQLNESNNIPYPTADMAKTLLDERTKPVKTTLVMTDTPKDTYYVAVLTGRQPKTADDFKLNIYSDSPASMNRSRGLVLQAHAFDAMQKAQESIVDLLKKEFRYVETDEQKKKLEENEKRGGGD